MWWFFCEELPNVRYCGFCHQPLPASHDFFNWHRRGRYGLHTQCKTCQRYYCRVLRQLPSAHGPPPATCPCGATGRLEVDHDGETNVFRAWLCRRCNLRARNHWQRGPRSNPYFQQVTHRKTMAQPCASENATCDVTLGDLIANAKGEKQPPLLLQFA